MILPRDGCILGIDQGTTSTKVVVLDDEGRILARKRSDFITPAHPHATWVEYNPWDILASVRNTVAGIMDDVNISAAEVRGVGLANQGESVLAFDAATGTPITPVISWQDRRSQSIIDRWMADDLQASVVERTGLRLDPYFSLAKWAWILENAPEAQTLYRQGRLRLCTTDSWIIWQLSRGESFVTDLATASRTALLDLRSESWSQYLADRMGIDLCCLPKIVPNSGRLAQLHDSGAGLRSPVPLTGACVDQQASLFGHGCVSVGQTKATFGTGCFILSNLGCSAERRTHGLLTSVAWKLSQQPTIHSLEGGIYAAGSLLDWLINLGLVQDRARLLAMMGQAPSDNDVVFIPALNGLAAPYWCPQVRACWLNITAATDAAMLLRAAVESIFFRVRDVVDAIAEAGVRVETLRVDGGICAADVLLQLQADILERPVQRVAEINSTAAGVGWLAIVGANVWSCAPLPLSANSCSSEFVPDPHRAEMLNERYHRWRRHLREAIR